MVLASPGSPIQHILWFKFLLLIRTLHVKLYIVLPWNQNQAVQNKQFYICSTTLMMQVSSRNKHRIRFQVDEDVRSHFNCFLGKIYRMLLPPSLSYCTINTEAWHMKQDLTGMAVGPQACGQEWRAPSFSVARWHPPSGAAALKSWREVLLLCSLLLPWTQYTPKS